MTARTRVTVSSATGAEWLMTRLTVAIETPARSATSAIVAGEGDLGSGIDNGVFLSQCKRFLKALTVYHETTWLSI
jgi:hypothetical protein